ncbi:MAG: hypothetical protein WKF63_07100, partial [Thermomicrobiales bacterium]
MTTSAQSTGDGFPGAPHGADLPGNGLVETASMVGPQRHAVNAMSSKGPASPSNSAGNASRRLVPGAGDPGHHG